jgi:hypothetical protein
MDPFIESQEWTDFHSTLITVFREMLTPQLGDRYVARVERRIYVEQEWGERTRQFGADVAVVDRGTVRSAGLGAGGATALAPVECELPLPVERRESYLVIRDRQSHEVVTVIEVLSPSNKALGSDGRRAYLAKRNEILQSRANLVELDLLRGGARLPLLGPVPTGDYYAIISRHERRPKVDVFAWTLRHELPEIPIPLNPEDPEAKLDVQKAVSIVFDRARYDHSLDCHAVVEPALSREDADWAAELLRAAGEPRG